MAARGGHFRAAGAKGAAGDPPRVTRPPQASASKRALPGRRPPCYSVRRCRYRPPRPRRLSSGRLVSDVCLAGLRTVSAAPLRFPCNCRRGRSGESPGGLGVSCARTPGERAAAPALSEHRRTCSQPAGLLQRPAARGFMCELGTAAQLHGNATCPDATPVERARGAAPGAPETGSLRDRELETGSPRDRQPPRPGAPETGSFRDREPPRPGASGTGSSRPAAPETGSPRDRQPPRPAAPETGSPRDRQPPRPGATETGSL
ncbi:hypothetical protein NDU88_006507 [Pleurodeles waltl]|uniref:Uncharacterized protein n=1 Tax=Pleurodeles waltl TaxID=8319 RepID=A0AAV7LAG4_PLEWA|nr:hypothetical protein NDU88_006507 [Pleurodeles waltl]